MYPRATPLKGTWLPHANITRTWRPAKTREAIEAGDNVLREKGMVGILQESAKAGPIKCQYVINVLRSVEGQIIDAHDSGLWTRLEHWVVSHCQPSFHQKGWKERFPYLQRPGHNGDRVARVLPILLLCLYQSPHPEQPHPGCTCTSLWLTGWRTAGSWLTTLKSCGSMLLTMDSTLGSQLQWIKRNDYG